MGIALGIILLVAAIFLIIAVLLQSSKSKGLSGTIAGGSETFFGKNKAKSMDKKLSVMTTIVAVVFVIITLSVFVLQDYTDIKKQQDSWWSSIIESINKNNSSSTTDTASDTDTSSDTATDTSEDTATDTSSAE